MTGTSKHPLGQRTPSLAITALLSTGFLSALAPAGAAPVQVEVKGIRIVSPPYRGEQRMRAFNWLAGTALALEVTVPQGGLIRLNDDACTIESMSDDRGRNLLAKSKDSFGNFGVGSFPSFSEDGKAAVVEISAPQTPYPGAKRITAKGKLSFVRATVKKTSRAAVKLKEGETVKAGPVPLTLTKAGKPDWGDEPLEITLRATQETFAIDSIRFFDAGGKLVKSRSSGKVRSETFGKVRTDMSFALKRELDAVTVEVSYWEDMQQVVVPFEVDTSVGM